MRLYHATLKSNLESIRQHGINPDFSQGKQKVIWLHTASRTHWAILHILKRHNSSIDEIIIIQVEIPRKRLRRRRRGLWTTTETLTEWEEITEAEHWASSPIA